MIHERHMNIIWKNCECETAHVHIRPKQGAFLFLRLCWQTMFSLTNRALRCYIVPIPDDVGRALFFQAFSEIAAFGCKRRMQEYIRTPPADGIAIRAIQR